ncbi:hypothetical protein MMC12_006240 [Toensbergia leucococca]|nr:hypothetical protein [Toensbergia leucococca]
MMTILNLPTELVQLILSYLEASDALKDDLVALSYVCKPLRKLTEPFLYRSIKWAWDQDWNIQYTPPLHLLLRTVLNRPELASHIENARFRNWNSHNSRLYEIALDYTWDEVNLARDSILSASFPKPHFWIQGLLMGKPEVLVPLLILHLPKLKTLDLGFSFHHPSCFMREVFESSLLRRRPSSNSLSTFHHLKTVDFGAEMASEDDEEMLPGCTFDLFEIEPLFYLPSIQTLDTSNLRAGELEWPTAKPEASTLTRLVLYKTQIQGRVLEEMLSVCPNLKTLKYEFHGEIDQRDGGLGVFVDCTELSKALSHVSATLEHLKISVLFTSWNGHDEEHMAKFGIRGRFDSLQQFKKLASIDISWEILLGLRSDQAPTFAEVLPPGLQKLTIRNEGFTHRAYQWNEAAYLAKLAELLREKKSHVPQLELIRIRMLPTTWSIATQRELKRECERARVACGILRGPPSKMEVVPLTTRRPWVY